MHRNPREAAVPIRDWLGNDLYRVPAGLWRRKQIANSDPLATVGRRIDFACHRHEVQRRAHWRQRRQLWGYSGGSDRLIGNEGNDLLIAAPGGSNYIDGGSGIDWLSSNFPAGTLGGLTINLTLQGKAQNTGQGMWTILNIENVSGSTGDDLITGDAGSNYLVGSAGSDRLYGGAGNDTLLGDGGITSAQPSVREQRLFTSPTWGPWGRNSGPIGGEPVGPPAIVSRARSIWIRVRQPVN